jgi:hypothetical protein
MPETTPMPKTTAKIFSQYLKIEIERVAGLEPQRLEHHQVAREPNGKGREDEVERHRERELLHVPTATRRTASFSFSSL